MERLKQVQTALRGVTIEGNIAFLPVGQLDRHTYMDAKKALNLIGGKWKGGKTMGFVFQEDPTDLIARISGGEKVNLKKQYQFFATPDKLADLLVKKAEMPTRWKNGSVRNIHVEICEPSAGQGAIIKAIHRHLSDQTPVYAFELMEVNRIILKKIPNILLSEQPDFLKTDAKIRFDRIIANPPFSKNQDIDHIYQMYKYLKPGGRMVTIASSHWKLSTNKKEIAFKKWLDDHDAKRMDISQGTFKNSGTMVGGVIIVIDK